MSALFSKTVEVDDDVAGLLWSVDNLDELAQLIAVISVGQAEHAARIIRELEPHGPALSDTQQTVWKVASIGFPCGLRRARI